MASVKDRIEIRQCHSLDEFEEGVRLERVIWGEEITVPAPIFLPLPAPPSSVAPNS